MNGDLGEAARSARVRLGLDADEPARTWLVAEPDGGRPLYVLVVLGPAWSPRGVAAVDPVSHEVLESAPLPGRNAHEVMTDVEAARRAGLESHGGAALVWASSSATRSRFFPQWELPSADGSAVWVDAITGDVRSKPPRRAP